MKLFVTDYDNTLYFDEESMKLNIEKLNALKEKDYIILISTGRSIPSIKEKIKKYDIPFDYVNCADGSLLYDKNFHLIKLLLVLLHILN